MRSSEVSNFNQIIFPPQLKSMLSGGWADIVQVCWGLFDPYVLELGYLIPTP